MRVAINMESYCYIGDVKLHKYSIFQDKCLIPIIPGGYNKIEAHLVYDVDHDGSHKERSVSDWYITDIPVNSVYSGLYLSEI